ncbi:MAG: aconitase X swivel domain-containing protein [Blastocatellia bacterium]
MERVIQGRALVGGEAEGEALVAGEPLSFWGGYDQRTGEIIDRRHPLSGRVAAARVLVIPASRGSSTTTAVLLEAIKSGKAPAAIVTKSSGAVDHFFSLASIVAGEMYGKPIPIVAVAPEDFAALLDGQRIRVCGDGRLIVRTGAVL